jgi:tetratricopeptide (TPR) repeat protein
LAQKQITRRQLVEDARAAALEGNWEDAVALNQQIIDRFDKEKDAEAYNRLGRAYNALGNLDEAKDAYTKALKADPANLIARRNLQRLEVLRGHGKRPLAEISRPGSTPRTGVFLEEVGRTWVDELVNPGELQELADVSAGEQLLLTEEDDRLIARRTNGQRMGEVEPKTARRVMELIAGGNRYEMYALGLTGQTLRTIMRETYRDPALATAVSFPRQITSRTYLRDRDLLRQRDESEFYFFDEEEDEETEAAAAEADEEEGSEGDQEEESFLEDASQDGEEEEDSGI